MTDRVRGRPARAALAVALSMVTLAAAPPLSAHHSFAVFFDTESEVRKVTGVVTEFRFTNPHGLVTLTVHEGKKDIIWRAETNSPSVLRRRGWTIDSIHVGETLTVEGWPARDGTLYMRLRSAAHASGQAVGTAPTPMQEK